VGFSNRFVCDQNPTAGLVSSSPLIGRSSRFEFIAAVQLVAAGPGPVNPILGRLGDLKEIPMLWQDELVRKIRVHLLFPAQWRSLIYQCHANGSAVFVGTIQALLF
jgi:hypothetical protein